MFTNRLDVALLTRPHRANLASFMKNIDHFFGSGRIGNQRPPESSFQIFVFQIACPLDHGLQFGKDLGSQSDLCLIPVQMQLIATQDDIDVQDVPQSTEILVASPKQASNVIMTAKLNSTFGHIPAHRPSKDRNT